MPMSRHASPGANINPSQRSASTVSNTILPAVPLVPLGQRTSTPKPKLSENSKDATQDLNPEELATGTSKAKETSKEAAKISLGSPKARPSRTKTSRRGTESEEFPHRNKSSNEGVLPGNDDRKGKEKIETSTPASSDVQTSVGIEKMGTPVLSTAMMDTPVTQSPRPDTPGATTPSEASKASVARPRTLRLTTGMIPKSSEPHPGSATTEKSSVVPPASATKRGSRRPSVSSVQHSRPSTPALSELLSNNASRASSPPPSIVGSAPERTKSKNQQKKDRRDKAKKTPDQANSPTVSVGAQTTMEEVAPVIARQKKQKRRVESIAGGSAEEMIKPASRTLVEVPEKSTVQTKPQPVPPPKETQPIPLAKSQITKPEPKGKATASTLSKPAKTASQSGTLSGPSTDEDQSAVPEVSTLEVTKINEVVKSPYTLRDLYNEVGRLTGTNSAPADASPMVQKLLNEHVSPMSKLIGSMIQSGDLAKDHPWLNPTSFNSSAYKLPPDSRRGQEYLDGNGYSSTDAFGHVYLPLKEKQALKEGHCVSIADGGDKKDDLLKKCLITSNGWVLRHLSGEETQKVIDLNERRPMYLDEFGEVGIMDGLGALEHDDFSNLVGGMEHLSRFGEHHGVVWVVGEGEHGDFVEEEDDDEFDIYDDEDGEIEGEIGMPSDDEDFEVLQDHDALEPDSSLPEGPDDGGSMNWDLPPPVPSQQHQLARPGRQSNLPGFGQFSKKNTFSRAMNPGLSYPNAASANGLGKGRDVQLSHEAHPMALASDALNHASRSSGTAGFATNTNTPVNLRALDSDALAKRVTEKHKELEMARKEMDKMEKLWNKKSKDIGRWREGLVKA